MAIVRVLLLLGIGLGHLIAAEPEPPPGYSTARPQITITTDTGAIVVELFADQAPTTVRRIIGLAEGLIPSQRDGERAAHHFYDGLTFHRVIPDFMIQGGCPLGNGRGGPGFRFHNEINGTSLGLDREMAVQDGRLHRHCGSMRTQFQQAVLAPRMQARGVTRASTRAETQEALQAVLAELDGDYSLLDFYRDLGYRFDPDLPASTPPTRGVIAMANAGPSSNGSQFFITVGDSHYLSGKHTVFGRVVAGMEVADAISAAPTGDQNRPTEPVVIERIRLTTPADPADLFTTDTE